MSVQLAGGIVPPIITPLQPDGSVDTDSLSNLTEHLVAAGAEGIFVLGSTGDVSYLSDRDRDLVVRTVVQAVAGRVPVLAGAIEMSAARVADQVARHTSSGADFVVATAPMYALNDSDEIERHFRAIARASTAPVVAYDIPVRVGTKLSSDLLVRLGEDGVICAVKDSSSDVTGFRWLIELNARAGSPLRLFSGLETMGDAAALWGADGSVPGLSNVDPAGHVRTWKAAAEGDWANCAAEQRRLIGLFDIVRQAPSRSFDVSGAGAFKVALVQQGIIAHATVPAPLEGLGVEVEANIKALVAAAGLVTL